MTLLSTNRVLLEKFRAGDEGALREVFRHYAPRVAAHVRRGVRVTRGREHFSFRGPSQELEVERIVHESFSRAFSPSARAAYDGVTPFGAYLCRIARNLMINEALANRRAGELTLEGELPELEQQGPTPEEVAERDELTVLVRDFLSERPELERQVYAERFQHGRSQEVAAAQLGLARITVRRAEERLKAAFLRFMGRRGALKDYAPEGGGRS
ncbi:MAG: sigma-70 family RNA polymerase sigma factor [Myxococcota bacterium]